MSLPPHYILLIFSEVFNLQTHTNAPHTERNQTFLNIIKIYTCKRTTNEKKVMSEKNLINTPNATPHIVKYDTFS